MVRRSIKKLLHKLGFDVMRYNPLYHPIARRMKLIHYYKIDVIFDVGANTGQYAKQMRELGYQGRIVSFEPLASAYTELVKHTNDDPHWDAVNIALGDYDGEAEINVSANSSSSSILDMLPAHARIVPESGYIGKEKITVRKIDSIINEHRSLTENLYLKIDTQGYERRIIEGAEASLEKIIGVQMEVSLTPLYEGEILLPEMINFMSDKGYELMSIEPVFNDPSTGQLLQVDCIFFRS